MVIVDGDLYRNYPRVAATAELYDFTYEDIRQMIDKISNSHYRELIWVDNIEICLKALLVRMDTRKEDFNQKLSELVFMGHGDLNELRRTIGIMQLPFVYALYNP